jgi:alkylhydroperoxidase family enzyme
MLNTKAFINPPKHIPFYLKLGIWISNKVTKQDLLVPKLLSWYPKVAISSAIIESLVAHGKKNLNPRILKLVRVQASLTVSCPFCIDMNSFDYKKSGITEEELLVLSGRKDINEVPSFSLKEKVAIEYTQYLSKTPIVIPKELSSRLITNFTEREIVILSSTIAQVNYWARLIQGLGVPPAGFSNKCEL